MAVMRQLIGRIGRLVIDEVVSQSSFNCHGALSRKWPASVTHPSDAGHQSQTRDG